mmetsp:Transcript_22267/g.51364  ORF Transcript_22267/g.51364 Transcript_22267/m.51364 type:complete len:181 (+) Transcript_22267:72-614(+)|eukprot:CAMPEP_0116847942 /NCGR_PEP_ID=MMETSP0418-20121206/14710_1 /TAXON_ID=1158023 /ORGANISM="Astrosyne radiata, Strain 13vi08-1A" /LENGTH=180 /DNA_ID=CAMNT_0004479435 /DNA_START=50 /DNA_END=592 /DNA_ORIENTATION=-
MTTLMDTAIADMQAQIHKVQQERQRMRLEQEERILALELRHRQMSIQMERSFAFHRYYEAVKEPNQAPYVTKQLALLCYSFVQNEQMTQQAKLKRKHAVQMIRMHKEYATKLRNEQVVMEKTLDEAKQENVKNQQQQQQHNNTTMPQKQWPEKYFTTFHMARDAGHRRERTGKMRTAQRT